MSAKKKGSVADAVSKLAAPFARQLGLTLWDVRLVKEGGTRILRIYIDKPGGVGIEDCEKMSRAVNAPLDELDPISEAYCLEVSSPGINRELTREEHFAAYAGSPVTMRLIRPAENGEKELKGSLLGLEDGAVTISGAGEQKISVPRKEIASVRLAEDDFVEGTEKR